MKIILWIASGTACAAPALAQETGAAFLDIDPSPRSYALGGFNAATAEGAQAASANPANLGLLPRHFEVFSSFSSMMESEVFSHVSVAFSRSVAQPRLLDSLGFSVTNLSVPDLEGRDASGNRTGGSFGMLNRAYAMTASFRLSEKLRMGVTGKAVQADIAGYGAGTTWASDVGATYLLRGFALPMTLGLAVRNLGQSMRYLSQEDPLPTSLNAALGLGLGSLQVLVGARQTLQDQNVEINGGLEFTAGPMQLRAGYRSGTTLPGNNDQGPFGSVMQNLSTGAGFRFGSMRLDYALSQQPGDFGLSHRASLTIQWGQPAQSGKF